MMKSVDNFIVEQRDDESTRALLYTVIVIVEGRRKMDILNSIGFQNVSY
jgi:hypothetical protein